jgi:Protein of unknown function (DUF4031)
MAVVIHAARATRDWYGVGVAKGERVYHVLSDQMGEGGQRELREFVAKLGIRARWAQYPGTYREHFDAPGRALDDLLRLGGRMISTHDLGALLAAKRATQANESPS